MARKKINLENIKEQVLEDEAIVEENETSIEAMSSVGAGSETTAVKPKRKGLLFLSLLLIFIILLSCNPFKL